MNSLAGKKIVVIGGSRGTGRAMVEALLAAGADVLVIARNVDSLSALQQALPSVRTLAGDATDEALPAIVFHDAPDMVVLVAGAMPPVSPVQELDWETFSVNWHTDVKASFQLAKYALTQPVKPGTQIVFISSGAGMAGSPISGGYAGSKRTQMFLTNYAQQSSDKLRLGLRFIAIVPLRLMEGTSIGALGINNYAAINGVTASEFVAKMPNAQTKEDMAAAIVSFAAAPPPNKEGNIFIVAGSGVVQEAKFATL